MFNLDGESDWDEESDDEEFNLGEEINEGYNAAERELKARTPSTLAVASTIAHAMKCSKCGTFKKSGRVSCCAPGGAWYKNCGGSSNKNAVRTWFEGVNGCKRKCEANAR